MNYLKQFYLKSKIWFPKFLNRIIRILGWTALIAIILTFTDVPYLAYFRLGTVNANLDEKQDFIVMLGGVGMPSPDDLMRTYFTAWAWKQVPDSKVIIAFPSDTSYEDESPELLMAKELKMRGVDSAKILFEKYGYSTRTQAIFIRNILGKEAADTSIIRIITSPEHMFRAIRTFRKAGFYKVGGSPAFESAIDEDRLLRGKHKTPEKFGLSFRYRMWSYMVYEITVLREFCAITYYKIRGWI